MLGGKGGESVDARTVVADVREAGRTVVPFDDRIVEFTARLSKHLRTHPRLSRVPAVAALAFWIRPARIAELAKDWQRISEERDDLFYAPRGVVFHVPPSNVDTLFIYSWLLSALMGNANVVRISESSGEGTIEILEAIGEVISDDQTVNATTAFVQYGHDKEITELLSLADCRIIWGGDDTVRAIRAVPMNPLGTEVAFGNRESMAVFDAQALTSASDERLNEIARLFFNDSYWFDQLACSSPRVVFFRGSAEGSAAAASRLGDALKSRVEIEQYQVPTGALMNKLVAAAAVAGDGGSGRVDWASPEVTVVDQPIHSPGSQVAPGGGFFSFRSIGELSEMVSHVSARIQTLSHFGIAEDDLVAFAQGLNGVGIDRIVPVGQALNFDRFWDGHDLLRVFSKSTALTI